MAGYGKLQIGNVTLENNIILGPMAGVSDLPFRLLCREMGAGLVCMEMVSAKAIIYKNRNTGLLMEIHEDEHPVSLQLFGSEPAIMQEAVGMIKDRPYDILDVNMGCPVPKVVSNGEGSALMKKPELIQEIVAALVKVSDRPVTVKIRKGFNDASVNAVECALAATEGGAAAIAVHGRTREQYYSGEADWEIISKVKEAVNVPVIGNGDVNTPQDAQRMFDETGCDGVMVARAAQGNPFIFREFKSFFEIGEICEKPSMQEIYDTVIRHADLQLKYKGEYIGIREMRKHVSWYTYGMPGSAKFRNEINQMTDMDSLKRACAAVMLGQ
ncbi:tRNA dihydrouridine synthase DusB [Butyrivibrio sp. INlla21]|uniref:tRNA dihydrouridine synthase DusB n=1 Tax=Butyrivibrio sp. INlla21 TaxID=1520811 RepID=UPI0008F339BC|nr:tRNA dihydrouridine synthase DusB [Butyrivibrio sp. INlla21]SFU88606.1 putative TIM-barrel protein, nifR3 family [Butyrivibrio sp. INlla21]